MKTTDDFYYDSANVMLSMANKLTDMGYEAHVFENLDGDTVLSVTMLDSEGEEVEYTATFERV